MDLDSALDCVEAGITVILQLDGGNQEVTVDSTQEVEAAIANCLDVSDKVFSVYWGGEPVDLTESFATQGIESDARLSVILDDATWRERGYKAARIERTKIRVGRTRELGLADASFTIEAWVKVNKFSHATGNAWNDDNTIFGTSQYNNGVGLHCIIRAHCARFDFYCNGIAGSRPIPLREWSHIAFVYDKDAQSQAILVNGEVDTRKDNHAPLQGDVDLDIGSWAGGRYLDGDIAEFRIWNVARSDDEIRDEMHRPHDILADVTGLRKSISFIEGGEMIDHVSGHTSASGVEVVDLESPFRGT